MNADLFIPHSVEEALSLLQAHSRELLVMGGGTVIMGHLNEGLFFPRKVMSLMKAGMDGVRKVNGHTEIGATTTLARVSQLKEFPILAQAAHIIGGPAIRNMGTLGGNILLPQPYGDALPPLLAYDAEVELAGARGRRTVTLEQFLAEPRSHHGLGELLLSIKLPSASGKAAYMKFGRRAANTPSIVAVAARIVADSDGKVTEARIALGAAGPIAFRSKQAEAALIGQKLSSQSIAAAAQAATDESDPATDALATAWYRRKMVGVFVKRTLEQLA